MTINNDLPIDKINFILKNPLFNLKTCNNSKNFDQICGI